MKRCQKCGYENSAAMSFCMECGSPLSGSPAVGNAQNESQPTISMPGGAPTNFGAPRQTENFSNNQQNFIPNYAASAPPKRKSKLGLIIGGLAALLVLLGIAGVAIVAYNLSSRKAVTSKPSPTPVASKTINNDKSPTPKAPVALKDSPTSDPSAPPQVSFTPPLEPTKKGTFTVYANGGWQLSEIDVVPLEQFRTSVQGLIDVAGVKTGVSSNGVKDAASKGRRIYPEFPTGALLMRTRYADGKYSNVQPVTAAPSNGTWQNFPDELGKLEFCINDNAPEQNGGQFSVTATMTSVPKQKK